MNFNKMAQCLRLLIVTLIITSCVDSKLTQKNLFSETSIADITNIPQSGQVIAQQNASNPISKKNISFQNYINQYFSPWSEFKISTNPNNFLKIFNSNKKRYAENFAVYPDSWYQELAYNANMNDLGKVKSRAIIVNNTSLRNMPTMKPAYYDPYLAGEGYPFDSIQENLLRIGEPVLLSHFTKDGLFAFIETNAKSAGFVKTEDLALVDKNLENIILNSKFIMITQDNAHLYNKKIYIGSVNLGTLLPINSAKNIVAPIRDTNGMAKLIHIDTVKSKFIDKPLEFNNTNVKNVVDSLINKPYGWGGYLNNRDCAQLVKDYFAVFGIHMPVFSGEQIKVGNFISLETLNDAEKISKIYKEAIPFKTILYRKGHVGIYLGQYNGKPIMFHSVWGVRTYDWRGIEYRNIIGKSAITSLEFGKELKGFDKNKSSFLKFMSSMAIIEPNLTYN